MPKEKDTSSSKFQLQAEWSQFREELVSQGKEKWGSRTEAFSKKASLMEFP